MSMPFFRCYSPSPYSYFAQQNCYLRKEEEVEAASSDAKEANSSSSTSSDDNECCDNSISSNENASSNASRFGLRIFMKQSTCLHAYPVIEALPQRIHFNYTAYNCDK